SDEPSRESVAAEVREIADRLGVDTLRREDFARESSLSLYQVYNLFPDDGWRGSSKPPVFGCLSRMWRSPMKRCWRSSIGSSARWAGFRPPTRLMHEEIFPPRFTKSGLAASRAP